MREFKTDAENNNPLHLAVKNGDIPLTKILLKYSNVVNLFTKNREGNNPLNMAVIFKRTKIIKILLEAGCPFRKNKQGDNPLNLAAIGRDKKAIKILLNYNCPIKNDNSNYSPLHKICHYYISWNKNDNGIICLKLLIEKCPYEKDNKGRTPLQVAGQTLSEIIFKVMRKRNNNLEFSNLQKNFLKRKVIL